MGTKNIINEIINLPEKFYALGNISIYSLLEETGYFERHNQVSEAILLGELINRPQSVNQWLNWSDNKRSASGWYFKLNTNGKYVVGYFPLSENSIQLEYNDSKEACAAFIAREIEEIRTS
jgi:hypothetical protein